MKNVAWFTSYKAKATTIRYLYVIISEPLVDIPRPRESSCFTFFFCAYIFLIMLNKVVSLRNINLERNLWITSAMMCAIKGTPPDYLIFSFCSAFFSRTVQSNIQYDAWSRNFHKVRKTESFLLLKYNTFYFTHIITLNYHLFIF